VNYNESNYFKKNEFIYKQTTLKYPRGALTIQKVQYLLNVRLFLFRFSDPQHDLPGIQHDSNEKNDEGSDHQIHTPIRLFDQDRSLF